MINAQLKKGALELCVLSLLMRQNRYGYELAEQLSQSLQISDGAVYPVLRKLAADGSVTTYLQESSGGPPRKYYALTPQGKETQGGLLAEWRELVRHVDAITGGDLA